MKRREFITLLGGAAASWPVVARAQQVRAPVVGFLNPGSSSESGDRTAAFRTGLNDNGYVDGQNITIEYRWAEGHYDRLPALAAELVRRSVAVIVTAGGNPPTFAAKAATTTIPIVFLIGQDPVESGLVTNFSRPDGNLTGISIFTTLLTAKRQELMRELIPSNSLVAILVNPTNGATPSDIKNAQVVAGKMGQKIQVLPAGSDREIEEAFAIIIKDKIGGLVVQGDPLFTNRRDYLVLLTTRHTIPTIFAWREFAQSGGLISYGTNLSAAYRQAGVYVGRILKGAKPADLPIQQSAVFELVVNLKAAKALGITIPTAILLRADEVIE